MPKKLPTGITRQHIVAAIVDIDRGVPHTFGASTGYDVLYEGRRYAPKALVGLAAEKMMGQYFGPYDFKGGLKSECFRILEDNGFTIVTKGDKDPFPDEVSTSEPHIEGAVERVSVNRYERDPEARAKAIEHYGAACKACGLDFETAYGPIGEGFIHVHHVVPLSSIGGTYVVDPIKDLVPVCPNCHAMLHKRVPPYTVDELQRIIRQQVKQPSRR
jgi:5-methylcytosine-specific restriction enzyme A